MFLFVHPFFIVWRPSPNRIASVARLDCVRCPIGLRLPPDWIASATQSDCVRCTMIDLDV